MTCAPAFAVAVKVSRSGKYRRMVADSKDAGGTRQTPCRSHMPFEITTTRRFAAAHQLRLYDGSLEPLHGHNWRVTVTVAADELDAIGVVMDFHELDRMLDAIVSPWHNRHLNEVEPRLVVNASTENVAQHIGRALKLPANVRLVSVQVWETGTNSATYRPSAT